MPVRPSALRVARSSLLATLALAGAVRVHAQGAPDTLATGPLRGVVFDSLVTNAPLEGATVWIGGTDQTARTDARGRFLFERVRAGEVRVTFEHPALDSAGIIAPAARVQVLPRVGAVVQLATPSGATLRARACGDSAAASTAVLVGVVRDAGSDEPVAGATVAAEWTEFAFGGGRAGNAERAARDTTDETGRFRLCGIPNDVELAVRAEKGQVSALVNLDLAGGAFAVRELHLAPSTVATGYLTGVVRRRDLSPIPGAQLTVVGLPVRASSGQDGRYTLENLPAGSRIVEVRAIGFAPLRRTVVVRPGRRQVVDIQFTDSVQVLDPLTVTTEFVPVLERVGFESRRKSGGGYFMTADDIRRKGSVTTEELFRGIPGVQVLPSGFGFTVRMTRSFGTAGAGLGKDCQPQYYVDGAILNPPTDLNAPFNLPIPPQDIEGIETYPSLVGVPAQFMRANTACGIIVIWTKRGAPSRPQRTPTPRQ